MVAALSQLGRLTVKGPKSWNPGIYFIIAMTDLILLLVGAVAYAWSPELSWLPRGSLAFAPVVSLWVPWAGSLGGVCISLVGIARYASRWDGQQYGYWHLARPFLGGVFGTIAVLIVVLVLQNIALSTAVTSTHPPEGTAVLTVIAFVVGFRESAFRDLVTKVVDVILGPGKTDDNKTNNAATVAFVPSVLDFGPAAVTSSAPLTRFVHLFNGTADTIHIAAKDVTLTGGSPGLGFVSQPQDADIGPSQSLPLVLTWKPTVPVVLQAKIQINLAGQTKYLSIKGTAT
jgi:hypothetical protein